MIGSSKEQLFDFLQKIDNATEYENIAGFTDKRQYDLTINSTASGITGWTMEDRIKKKKTRGRGFESLKQMVIDTQVSEIDGRLTVLCLSDTKIGKTKIKTTWIKVDPGCPFLLKNGNPVFETICLMLPKEYYADIKETGIAIYNEISETMYPILKVACKSIGKLMDAESSFKYIDTVPLGTALSFAKRLDESKNIRFIHRKGGTDSMVKPLIGIAGSKYAQYSQYDFFQEAYEICCKHHICHVGEWTYTDELTRVKVVLDDITSCTCYVLLATGDVPGSSLSVTAYAQFGKGSVLLKRQSNYHSASFIKRGGVKALFDGIFESFDVFERAYMSLVGVIPEYDEKWISPIIKIIGSKRANAVSDSFNMSDSALLFKDIVKKTYCVMPTKQAGELERAYTQLFNTMYGEELIGKNGSFEMGGENDGSCEEYAECI